VTDEPAEPEESSCEDVFLSTLLRDNWTVIESSVQKKPEFFNQHGASVVPHFISSADRTDSLKIFFKLLPKPIWQAIANSTTSEMMRKKNSNKVNPSSSYCHRYYKAVSAEETVFVVACGFRFKKDGHTFDLKGHFQKMKDPIMNYDRYCAISSSLSCNIQEIADSISRGFAAAVNPEREVAFDEAVYSFFSAHHDKHDPWECNSCAQDEDPSPQRFIPRKPHPNGLLSYMAALKLGGSPYVLFLFADTDAINPLNGREAVLAAVELFKQIYGYYPHITLDAGFSGVELVDLLETKGCPYTLSLNISHFPWLFKGLSQYAAFGRWIALADQHGRIWSLLKGRSEEKVHFLVSNAMKLEIQESPVIVSEGDEKLLSKLSASCLSFLQNRLGLTELLDPKEAAASIVELANQGKGRSQLVPEKYIPRKGFTVEDLQNLKNEELVSMIRKARWAKVSKASSKAEMINIIIRSQVQSLKKKKSLQFALEKGNRKEQAPHHTHYKASFNSIDLHDRHWNALQGEQVLRSWKAKMIVSLLQTGFVNTWSIFRRLNQSSISFKNFMNPLSIRLTDSTLKIPE